MTISDEDVIKEMKEIIQLVYAVDVGPDTEKEEGATQYVAHTNHVRMDVGFLTKLEYQLGRYGSISVGVSRDGRLDVHFRKPIRKDIDYDKLSDNELFSIMIRTAYRLTHALGREPPLVAIGALSMSVITVLDAAGLSHEAFPQLMKNASEMKDKIAKRRSETDG